MVSKGIVYTLLIVGMLIFVLPLVLMVSTSLKSYTEINTYPPTFLPKSDFSIELCRGLGLQEHQFPTLDVQYRFHHRGHAAGCCAHLIVMRLRLRAAQISGAQCVVSSGVGFHHVAAQVTLIPLYILFHKLGWLNTFAPLIIPAWFGGGALNIFLLRQFFMQIPRDLDEAAIIDGAGHLRIWWSIYVPLSRPAMISVALLTV